MGKTETVQVQDDLGFSVGIDALPAFLGWRLSDVEPRRTANVRNVHAVSGWLRTDYDEIDGEALCGAKPFAGMRWAHAGLRVVNCASCLFHLGKRALREAKVGARQTTEGGN